MNISTTRAEAAQYSPLPQNWRSHLMVAARHAWPPHQHRCANCCSSSSPSGPFLPLPHAADHSLAEQGDSLHSQQRGLWRMEAGKSWPGCCRNWCSGDAGRVYCMVTSKRSVWFGGGWVLGCLGTFCADIHILRIPLVYYSIWMLNSVAVFTTMAPNLCSFGVFWTSAPSIHQWPIAIQETEVQNLYLGKGWELGHQYFCYLLKFHFYSCANIKSDTSNPLVQATAQVMYISQHTVILLC